MCSGAAVVLQVTWPSPILACLAVFCHLIRWKNYGGKKANAYIPIRGVQDRQIKQRKGKVIRFGLPPVKYDQLTLTDMVMLRPIAFKNAFH